MVRAEKSTALEKKSKIDYERANSKVLYGILNLYSRTILQNQ